jgi:hypothetical protein
VRLKRGSLSTIGGLIAIIWFASIFSSSDAPQEIASSASPTQTITQSSTPSPSVTESPTVSPETKSPEVTKPAPSKKPTTKPAADKTDLQALISELVLAAEQGNGYDRDLFRHWIDADGDGCNTRREVLIAEAKVKPSVFGDCDLTGGEWYSVYDQVTTNDPSDFDVDHFIPLKEAWDSGAYAWSSEKRKEFANDLGFGGSLIAVTASSNRSKSDRDPADWLPPNSGYHCRYITNWVKVKIRWGLTVDSAELATIKEFGNSCK